jgi:glycosyltransferase involved in cell wall biosynthesis
MQGNKGIFDLLEAYAGLCGPTANQVGLVYVGDGDHLGQLHERVSAKGMSHRVLILGRLPHQSLPAVMKTATVVATPTQPPLQEGRCMVVAESFVVGVPVIAPEFAAFPYSVVDGQNGLLFAPGQVDALTSCIERVAVDGVLLGRLRQGAAASGRLLLDGSPHDFASSVEAAFG